MQNLQPLAAGAEQQEQGADFNHGCLQDKGEYRELSWAVQELLSFNTQVGWQADTSASNRDDTTMYIIPAQKFLEGASEASHSEVKAGKVSEQQNPAKTCGPGAETARSI